MARDAITSRATIAAQQNLLLRSRELNDANWSKVLSTITSNAAASPVDGAMAADAFVDSSDVGASFHYVTQGYNTHVLGSVYCFSAIMKATGTTWISLHPNAGGAGAYFNLAAGVKGSRAGANAIDHDIISLGSGWYLPWITFYPSAASVAHRIYSATSDGTRDYIGAATSRFLIDFAQLVQANWPGAPCATTTVTVNTPIRNLVRSRAAVSSRGAIT